MEQSDTPAEERQPVDTQPEETQPVTPDAPAGPEPTAEPAEPAATLPADEPVDEPEALDAEVVDGPDALAAPSEDEPVDAEIVTEADTAPEPEIEPVAVDRPVGDTVPATEPLPEQLSLDEIAPAAPEAPDLGAVESFAPAQPAQATNLDLPSLELPHPAPEPARPVPPAAPAVPLGAGQDYTQSLAQSAYGQPTPQQTPAPQASPPYAAAPYATPPAAAEQYSQPQYSQPSYGTQPGYGQPGYGQLVGTNQLTLTDENTWATAAHWSSLLLGLVSLPFLGPLLVLLIQGPKSARVRANAVESLNFDITMSIATIVSLVLMVVGIGFITTPLLGILWLVMKIVAAVQTSSGQNYRYPFNIRMVK